MALSLVKKLNRKMSKNNIASWEEVLKSQPESYQKWFIEEKRYLLKNIKPKSKVLEVGCGDGRSIHDIIGLTQDIVGIDYDETAVEHAKEKLKNYPSVKIMLADGRNLPFEDNVFDYVICMTTFANFGEDKFKALNEMKRVLKSKDKIIISVFSEDALPERIKVYEKIMGEKGFEVKENGKVIFRYFGQDNVSEQFSDKQLISIFKKAGLRVEDIKKINIAYICKISK
ncbi:MAG: methyltransferase domain-containing protein [Nanoarchaeota archaeon]